ncbi:MAG TPA: thioredoxin domain-containing protein [Fimbriimonadales bacterium]|nr:thioredoxin domain-containing protein [Fimbriimonadales bacterium]
MSTNRLASAVSPYLRQHAHNPVHWEPWDPDALSRSKQEDKPIFLSIGYSSCHWCHVMERESFENEEIAKILNENFVCIKVDREERPDIDEAYMLAVQLATGHGGWPMSLFLTPDLKPFFAGTYFPPEDRGNYAGFKTLSLSIAQAWRRNRQEIHQAANEFAQALEQYRTSRIPPPAIDLSTGTLDSCFNAVIAEFREGRFSRPKFPAHSSIDYLLFLAEDWEKEGALEAAVEQLNAMALGGIHDHVGGGFHRYSTDEEWLLPHFEKMLYDNAQFLYNYARAYRLTGEKEYKRVCDRLAEWVFREMTTPGGAFYSAIDADVAGEEGSFYVWSADEIREILKEEAEEFLETFGCKQEGNYADEASGKKTGKNILHLEHFQGNRWDSALEKLRNAREKRQKPERDTKMLTSWNGLMISGLALSGYIAEAKRAADFLLSVSPIPHQYADSSPIGDPFLEAVYVVRGLLDLSDATEDGEYQKRAEKLFDYFLENFHDDENGGWFFSGRNQEQFFGRSKPVLDSATPSPNGVAIQCAVRLGRYEIAEKDLSFLHGWMHRVPTMTTSLHLALGMLLEHRPSRAAVQLETPRVQFEISPKEAPVQNGKVRYELKIVIPSGFYIPCSDSKPGETPFELRVKGEGKWEAKVDVGKGRLEGEEKFVIEGQPPSYEEGEVKVVIRCQLCKEGECLLPETREISAVWYREE